MDYEVRTAAGERRLFEDIQEARRFALKKIEEWKEVGRHIPVYIYYIPTGKNIPILED